jgi:hypothetical protein
LPTITYNFAKWNVKSSAKEIKKAASGRSIYGVEKQELIKEMTRFDAENTCPICLESFGCGREVSVMLCLHEIHKVAGVWLVRLAHAIMFFWAKL